MRNALRILLQRADGSDLPQPSEEIKARGLNALNDPKVVEAIVVLVRAAAQKMDKQEVIADDEGILEDNQTFIEAAREEVRKTEAAREEVRKTFELLTPWSPAKREIDPDPAKTDESDTA